MEYGPMRFYVFILSALVQVSAPVWAQGAPAPAGVGGERLPAETQDKATETWRSTAAYPFPALARTVADMQNLAYAMTLRDYCSDRRVPDEFVRERLARFSQITGRSEDCQSLLDY